MLGRLLGNEAGQIIGPTMLGRLLGNDARQIIGKRCWADYWETMLGRLLGNDAWQIIGQRCWATMLGNDAGRITGQRCWEDYWATMLGRLLGNDAGQTIGQRCWADYWATMLGRLFGLRCWADYWAVVLLKRGAFEKPLHLRLTQDSTGLFQKDPNPYKNLTGASPFQTVLSLLYKNRLPHPYSQLYCGKEYIIARAMEATWRGRSDARRTALFKNITREPTTHVLLTDWHPNHLDFTYKGGFLRVHVGSKLFTKRVERGGGGWGVGIAKHFDLVRDSLKG
ncbi:hypothetical protein Btru_046183 [Bulinus truncatus]|nr:hypothetical protein Btru_046183 [Bulinus truncatus]